MPDYLSDTLASIAYLEGLRERSTDGLERLKISHVIDTLVVYKSRLEFEKSA